MADIKGFKTINGEPQKIDANAISLGANSPNDGDVLTYKDESIKWVAPGGGGSYNAGEGIIINQNTISISHATNADIDALFASPGNTVTIGDKEYTYIQIGNLYWLVENLCYAWDGLTIGSTDMSEETPLANYWNRDSSYESDGLYYNLRAVTYLSDNSLLPEGWRVPTYDDYVSLITTIGGTGSDNYYTGGNKLKSTTGWTEVNGTDDFGFNGKPCGAAMFDGEQTWTKRGDEFWTWTKTYAGWSNWSLALYGNTGSDDDIVLSDGSNLYDEYPIRLCKNV